MTRRLPAAPSIADHLQAHLRLLICLIAGTAAGLLWPDVQSALSRALVGWNVLVWLYLVLVVVAVYRADHGHIKRVALAQAESATIALTIVVVTSVIALVAVVFELKAAKAAGAHHMLPHIAFAFVTVVGSWLLLPTLFGLSYASSYYGQEPDRGLVFPGATAKFEPDHTDFLYFSYTIAVACQTADVDVTTREMRRLVIVQSVISFVFNTTILAFSINAAASFF